MHPQPLTTIAPPQSGGDGDGFVEGEKINLDLGIGSCACASEVGLKGISQDQRESCFSDAQIHELCSQIFIFNSIACGFAVPYQLLLPIWMSVFSSLGPAIYKTYPSFSCHSPMNSDHSGMMDSEPGRCKRTDGRKWRCSKNVVPLHKYCERHMHRGRQGSRKHVEPIQRVSRHDSRTSDNSRIRASDIDNRVSNLGPNQPCSSYRTGINACNGARNSISIDYARSTCSSSKANYSTSGGHLADGKPSFADTNHSNIRSVVGSNYMGFTSPGFGLSPKSVLIAAGKVGLSSGCTTIMEAEPQRCRRTDGKKWQCRRDALHNQKYCEAHMHRGAKRLMVNPEYSSSFQTTPPCAITRNLNSGINSNTVPPSPRQVASNDSSSSTSDATTITDENISFCLSNSLHNG